MKRFAALSTAALLLLAGAASLRAGQPEAINPASTDDITLALARLAVETKTDEIPDRVYEAAKAATLDALGCAFAGHDATGVTAVVELTRQWGGRAEATVWFEGIKVPASEAAFANSVQLHAMDFDDYHPPSDAHITSVLVPTVLAEGQARGASGKETLAALIVGTEVVGRLGRAYKARREHKGFLPTSVLGGFGAVAAACRLRGCSVKQTANAMGIWYAHASGTRQALFDRTLTKRIQPGIAARAGVVACCMASENFTGPTRIVGQRTASLVRIYGCRRDAKPPTVAEVMAPAEDWQIEQLHYKRYACCGVCVNAIESAIELITRHDLKLDDIKEVRLFGADIHSPFGGVAWSDSETPQVLAQFCVPYAAASAFKNRCYGPAQIASDRIAEDHEVDALARRTRMCEWDEWQGTRPKAATGMQIVLGDGRLLESTGNGHRRFLWPEDREKLVAKFKSNLAFSKLVDPQRADELVVAIENLDACENICDFIEKRLVVNPQ